ncbi:MAG: ATP synthase F0 subunit B [Candidatus Magasanikbacteria bacterium]|nr:ATP synthase F0 subunit B [Candidatus Magasanikbacteria bacterium]
MSNIAYAAEGTTETESADTGVLASLGINGTLFTAQLINFTIIAGILWFLILKPLTKKLAERQKMIDDSIANSKKVQENLAKSEQHFQQRVDEAKVEANKVVERATQEAEKMGATMKTKAKQEIELLVDQAKRNFSIERDEMRAAVKTEAAEMITVALQKILAEKMTEKKDKELIAEMIKKME